MIDEDQTARAEILARLAASRQQLRQILYPQNTPEAEGGDAAHDSGFPRSHTLRLLLSGKGLGTLGAVVTGLLVSRPGLAMRLLRLLPVGAMVRQMAVRLFAQHREKG